MLSRPEVHSRFLPGAPCSACRAAVEGAHLDRPIESNMLGHTMAATPSPAGSISSVDGPGGGPISKSIPKSVPRGDPNAFTFDMIQQSFRREQHFKEVDICLLSQHRKPGCDFTASLPPGDG